MKRYQRGVALIVVLLIVAIIAIIATDITSRNQLAVRRTLNLAEYDQAYWYAMSAEQLIKKVLKKDLNESKGRVHLQQNWATSNVVFPAEYGEIAGKVTDLRSCFNLNALSQPSSENKNGLPQMPLAVEQFRYFLVALGMDDFAAEQLSQRLKDYLDTDSATTPFGAEDSEYRSRTVPYRAANTLMHDKSELRAVIGVTQELYKKIAPYICVIPDNDQQQLNINTVKPAQSVLLAGMLENKVSVEEAESMISRRPADGYGQIEDFWNDNASDLAGMNDQIKSSFTVNSDYFLLHSGAKVNQAVFQMQSILKRGSNNNIDVVARQFGVQHEEPEDRSNLQQDSFGE